MSEDETSSLINEDWELFSEKERIMRSVSIKRFMEMVIENCKKSEEGELVYVEKLTKRIDQIVAKGIDNELLTKI